MFSFKKYVDKVFIISLYNETARRASLLKMFIDMGCYTDIIDGTIEFYDAVKCLSIDNEVLELMDKHNKGTYFSYATNTFNQGLYNCSNEHYRLWNICYERGYQRVLILEDDITFTKDIELLCHALDNIPSKFNRLQMDCFYWPNNDEEYKRCLSILDNSEEAWIPCKKMPMWNMGAIVYSREGLSRIIEYIDKNKCCAEYTLFFDVEDCFFYKTPLAKQRHGYKSEITGGTDGNDGVNIYLKKTNLEEFF